MYFYANMGFTRKIQYYLVHTLRYSNKEAKKFIEDGAVRINNTVIYTNIEIKETDKIELHNKEIKKEKKFIYIKYYKPLGLVSSLNPKVKDSLFHEFKEMMPLSIAGRLDKFSEGLLVLTNDGKWQKTITDPTSNKEKEYIVEVDKMITTEFIKKMESGLDIGIGITKTCECVQINQNSFKIILTEGKNKQIRRMCKTLKYNVLKLKRVRIAYIHLNNLKPGEMLNFQKVL